MFAAVVQFQNTTHTPRLKDTAPEHFYSVVAFLLVLIFLTTRRAFKTLANYRTIKSVPTSLVRSAAQGHAELHGIQTCPLNKPLTSPLTFSSCTWFDYTIEQKVRVSYNEAHWVPIYHYTSKTPIMLRDKTGECWILPAEAEVSTADIFRCYASSGTPWNASYPANQKAGLFLHILWHTVNILTLGFLNLYLICRPYRHTEKIMKTNDPIYALGFFCSYHDTEQTDFMRRFSEPIPAAQTPGNKNVLSVSADSHTPFLLSSKTEQTLLREQLWTFLLFMGIDIALFSGLVFFVLNH